MKKYIAAVILIAVLAITGLNFVALKSVIIAIYNTFLPPAFISWGDATLIPDTKEYNLILTVNIQKVTGIGYFTIPLNSIVVTTPTGKTFNINNPEMRLSTMSDIKFDAKTGFSIFILSSRNYLIKGIYVIQFEIYDELGNLISTQTITVAV